MMSLQRTNQTFQRDRAEVETGTASCKFIAAIEMLAGAVAIVGMLPGGLRAESQVVAQSGLRGGIVVALDFPDGKAIADLAADGNFVVHGLLTTEAGVEKARREIAQAGRHRRAWCDTYNGRELPYVDNLVNLVLCKASCKVPLPELMRVIAPGGSLMVEDPGGWKKNGQA